MAVCYNPRIVTDGLVLALDAGNSKSYPGSGTTWTDLMGNGYNATVIANDASGVNISINKQDGGYHITIANAGNSNTIFGAWQLEASLYSNLGKPTLTIS